MYTVEGGTQTSLGPLLCANRQATMAEGDRLTGMTQPRRPCKTWGGATPTHVTHSCGFDPNWCRKASTCLARLPLFGLFWLRSHAFRDKFGTYSTDASSFRYLRRRWYVSFVGNHPLRPTTPRPTALRSSKGSPLYFTHYIAR